MMENKDFIIEGEQPTSTIRMISKNIQFYKSYTVAHSICVNGKIEIHTTDISVPFTEPMSKEIAQREIEKLGIYEEVISWSIIEGIAQKITV